MPFLILIALVVFLLTLVFAFVLAALPYLLLLGALIAPFALASRSKERTSTPHLTPQAATTPPLGTPPTHTPAAAALPPPTPSLPADTSTWERSGPAHLDPDVFGLGTATPAPLDTGEVATAQRWNALIADVLGRWVDDIATLDRSHAPQHTYRYALQRLEYQISRWLACREQLPFSLDGPARHPALGYLRSGELWELATGLYLETLDIDEPNPRLRARRWAARLAPHTPTPDTV